MRIILALSVAVASLAVASCGDQREGTYNPKWEGGAYRSPLRAGDVAR